MATLAGVLVLALLAGGLTEAALAFGHRGLIADDTLVRPKSKVTASPSPVATSTPTPTAAPTPAATPVPTPVVTPPPALPTARTVSFVRMRAGMGVNTAILYELNGDTTVYLLPGGNAQWQQVQYNGSVGYIFKTYLAY